MQYDKERSAVFEQYGVQVLRFRNQDVSAHFEMVCEQIHEYHSFFSMGVIL